MIWIKHDKRYNFVFKQTTRSEGGTNNLKHNTFLTCKNYRALTLLTDKYANL